MARAKKAVSAKSPAKTASKAKPDAAGDKKVTKVAAADSTVTEKTTGSIIFSITTLCRRTI